MPSDPTPEAMRLEKAIRGWLEGDDTAPSMAHVIDRALDLPALLAKVKHAEIGVAPLLARAEQAEAERDEARIKLNYSSEANRNLAKERDEARLDWLESQEMNLLAPLPGVRWTVQSREDEIDGDSLRAAIDAAMRSAARGGEE